MCDLEIEFKKEALYPDIIEVQLSSGEISKVGFDLYYQFFTKRDDNRILLMSAKTGMVCYDYLNKKVAPIPEDFKQLLIKK
jgi:acyl-CoA thioesterase FadM